MTDELGRFVRRAVETMGGQAPAPADDPGRGFDVLRGTLDDQAASTWQPEPEPDDQAKDAGTGATLADALDALSDEDRREYEDAEGDDERRWAIVDDLAERGVIDRALVDAYLADAGSEDAEDAEPAGDDAEPEGELPASTEALMAAIANAPESWSAAAGMDVWDWVELWSQASPAEWAAEASRVGWPANVRPSRAQMPQAVRWEREIERRRERIAAGDRRAYLE